MRELRPSTLLDSIRVPTSKSYTNRYLVLAALKKGMQTIIDPSLSTDCLSLKAVLEKIGIETKESTGKWEIGGSFPDCEKEQKVILETGDGGTTNRFILPLLGLGQNEYIVRPKSRFLKRPSDTLYKILKELGAQLMISNDQIIIRGPFKNRRQVNVDCNESSQYYSALHLINFSQNFDIQAVNVHKSKKYIEMTDFCLKEARLNDHFIIPPDSSSLVFPLVFSLIMEQEVVIENYLKRDLLQADDQIIDIATKLGAKLELTSKGLKIHKSNLKGEIILDAWNYPDLIPGVVLLSSNLNGRIQIKNLSYLEGKESNRKSEIIRILDLVGLSYNLINEDELILNGRKKKADYFIYNAPKDHRMIMLAALFMFAGSGGKLNHTDHVAKSFPNFFSIFR